MKGLTPAESLHRLGVREQVRLAGAEELVEPAYWTWHAHDGDQLFVAATAVGPWTLVVEPNGFLGGTEEAAVPLSRGTRLVSQFRNINAVDHLY